MEDTRFETREGVNPTRFPTGRPGVQGCPYITVTRPLIRSEMPVDNSGRLRMRLDLAEAVRFSLAWDPPRFAPTLASVDHLPGEVSASIRHDFPLGERADTSSQQMRLMDPDLAGAVAALT